MDGTTPNLYEESANFLRARLPDSLQKPKVAIICGSGLGGLAGTVCGEERVELDYASIPHFPPSTGKKITLVSHPFQMSDVNGAQLVEGHAGKLVFGHLEAKVPAMLMVGRTQFVE